MKRICFATNNKHKLDEVQAILTDYSIISLDELGCYDELEETQPTLEGNSLQKATFIFNNFKTPCFADDTGLEVEALQGAPGVYSARYAGEQKKSDDNITLLLKNLHKQTNRRAQFRTVITVMGLGETKTFEGIIKGQITEARKGAGGFGYDPVFQPDGYTKTFAEMSMAEKNKVSHRALAVEKLIAFLKALN